MEGWQVGRLLTAAAFVGKFLTVRLAILARGDDPWLLLELVADPDVTIARGDDAEWNSGFRAPVPGGWSSQAGNPWFACRYSGRLLNSTAIEVDQFIEDVSDYGRTRGAALAALLEAHLDLTSLDDDARSVLLRFIKKDLAAPRRSTLVRPEATDDELDLTLRAAQGIQQAVGAGEPLTATQRRKAELLLRYAPWHFGFWGPFKALVKAVPADELAEPYAEALARLSGTEPESIVPKEVRIEDTSELQGWFGIPTKRTLQYLARRVRRDLASLAERSPDAYAKVASRMLITWDQPLSNYSYAPAYVMLGARSALDDAGRYVRRPADMTVRREPHPEIWNERPELAQEVFTSVAHSVEALTWAAQVLDAVGAIPELPTHAIALALDSDYPPLRRSACSALPAHPTIFNALTASQWEAIFKDGSDTEIDRVAEQLATGQPSLAVGQALSTLLGKSKKVPGGRERLAVIYLAAPKLPFTHHDDADVAAVVAAIKAFGSQYQMVWAPVVGKMGPWGLFEIYLALAKDADENIGRDFIANLILEKVHHPPDLILECLGSHQRRVVDLGGRLVDAHGGRQFLFTQLLPSAGPGSRITPPMALRVVKAASKQATAATDLVALIRWALARNVDRTRLASVLSKHPLGPAALWGALALDDGRKVAEFAAASPEITRMMGDAVAAEQLSIAKTWQLELIERYLTENPARTDRDVEFAIAAHKTANPSLQSEALRQLGAAGKLPQQWLAIAETGRPAGVEAAREYLNSLTETEQIREAVLACLDSSTPAVRRLGIELFQRREALASDKDILAVLGASKSPAEQLIVAQAASSSGEIDHQALHDFDRRILTERKSSPRAKALVKKRLETADATTAASPERIAVLLQMARGAGKGDREWALMRLAALALQGFVIEGLEASLTTEGFVGLEDVAP